MSQPPAITAAERDQYDTLWLTLEGDIKYVLSPTDPYGLAPHYRAELDRMVDAGEITITNFTQPVPLGAIHYTWGPTIFETVGGQDYVGT